MKKEKKKKILYSVYSAVFVGICLVPAALTPFRRSDGAAENRTLAEKPSLKTDAGKLNFDFFSEFDTYFSEHFAFRQELVTLDGKIRAELMGTSSNSDVIVGKNGWLYYAPTADDFMNVNTLSDRAINNISHNLALLSRYCEDQHANFIFTIAPNKSSVYPEYMPYNYIETAAPGNYEKFAEAYSEMHDAWSQAINSSDSGTAIPEHFTFIDLKGALLETKENSQVPIYHKTDTHWNNIGALAARNALLSLSDTTDGFWDSSWSAANDWSGDLAEMIYPSDVPMDNQFYSSYDFTYQYVGRFRGFDDINIKTTCESPSVTSGKPFGKLLMYRDSFGEAILPFMAESFASAEFSRAVPYNTAGVTDGTTVILEIVERNLGNLQKYAPVMPAPVYSGELPEGVISSDAVVKAEDSGSYTHIYGELGDEFFKDDNARIFVTIGGETYEAFNCFEDKLLGREGETSDNSFSLYITKSDDTAPDMTAAEVTVLSGNGETVKFIS